MATGEDLHGAGVHLLALAWEGRSRAAVEHLWVQVWASR